MRALVVAVSMLSLWGCGGVETQAPEETSTAQQQIDIKERWCNSYKSERFCPRHVCSWHDTPAPGFCSSQGVTE